MDMLSFLMGRASNDNGGDGGPYAIICPISKQGEGEFYEFQVDDVATLAAYEGDTVDALLMVNSPELWYAGVWTLDAWLSGRSIPDVKGESMPGNFDFTMPASDVVVMLSISK